MNYLIQKPQRNPNNLIYSIVISSLYTGVIIAVLIGLAVLGVGVLLAVVSGSAH